MFEKDIGFQTLKYSDDELQTALEYYKKEEPFLATNIGGKLKEMDEINHFAMVGIITNYTDEYTQLTEDIRQNEDRYSEEYILQARNEVINTLRTKYRDKMESMKAKNLKLYEGIIETIENRMSAHDAKNEVDANEMSILQNKLKSELNQFRKGTNDMATVQSKEGLFKHLEQEVEQAKYLPKHARTLSVITYLYSDKLVELDANEADKMRYDLLIKELKGQAVNERYKADKVVYEHLRHRYTPDVVNVGLSVASEQVASMNTREVQKMMQRKTRSQF